MWAAEPVESDGKACHCIVGIPGNERAMLAQHQLWASCAMQSRDILQKTLSSTSSEHSTVHVCPGWRQWP